MASEKTRDGIDEIIDAMRKSMGLTLYEAKLYIALLQGARNPREASVKSGVPLPRIYDVVKVLEAKGFVERDPEGWYRPYTPRAVAAAALARVEEEARTRARMILDVISMLERIVSEKPGEASNPYIEGIYKIAAAAASAAEAGGPVYIGIGLALGKAETATTIIKSIMPVAAEIRALVDPVVAESVTPVLADMGIEHRITPVMVDFIAAWKGAVIIVLVEGSLVGVRMPAGSQAERLSRIAESFFKEGRVPA